MKIVFACDTLGSGGAERVISTLSNEFVSKGHQVSIIVLSKYANEPFYPLDKKIDVFYLTKNTTNKIGYFKKAKLLRNKITNLSPDIVISFLSYVCIYTWWALKNTRIPYIVSERNDPTHRGKIRQFLLNKSFDRAAGCVFQTEEALNYYRFINKDKKTVIYNPVHIVQNNRDNKKHKTNFIISVGRLETQKNPFILLKAFKAFAERHNKYVLKIYGDGSLKKELIEFVEVNKIKNVIFCGNSKTWQTDERNASMFIMTSDYEGLPNSLLEALCIGIPAVSTDCPIGGPRELKKHFHELELCKCNDVDSLLCCMEKSALKEQKNTFIPDVFRTDIVAQLWLDFIYRLLKTLQC